MSPHPTQAVLASNNRLSICATMDLKSSTPTDSVISMPEVDITQLKDEISQLRLTNQHLKQERDELSRRFQDEQHETSRLADSCSKQDRKINALEDKCAKFVAPENQSEEHKLYLEVKPCSISFGGTTDLPPQAHFERPEDVEPESIQSRLLGLNREYTSLCEGHKEVGCEVFTQTMLREIFEEQKLQAATLAKVRMYRVRLQLDALETTNETASLNYANQLATPNLEPLHKDMGCEHFSHYMSRLYVEARNSRKATESEIKLYQEFETLKSIFQERDSAAQDNALKAATEARIYAGRVSTLQAAVDLHHEFAAKADKRIEQLESLLQTRESEVCEPENLSPKRKYNFGLAKTLSKYFQEPKTPKVSKARVELADLSSSPFFDYEDPDNADVLISPRVSTALPNTLQAGPVPVELRAGFDLDCTSTQNEDQEVANDLVAEIQRIKAHLLEETAAASHWQKVALTTLTEVDELCIELNEQPMCRVPAHRSMADELEAKNHQLQLQSELISDWQNKSMDCAHQ